MSQFDDREKAFEKKSSIDAELEFKVTAKAARLLSAWAAEQLELSDAAAESYAKLAVDLVTARMGHDQLMNKIESDLKEKGVKVTRHGLEHEMNGFTAEARTMIAGKV